MKVEYPTNKEYFMSRLQDIHFGEWKPEYNSDYMMDGIKWKLKLHFDNDQKKLKFYGSNSYPYNFDDLKDLINELTGEPLL